MTNRRAPFNVNVLPSAGPLPPGSTFAGPIFANEAAASAAAGLADGQQVFILSHRSIWISQPSCTLPVVANEIINRSGGGRLLRTTYSDPAWRTVNDVYIDPANVAASNENNGLSAGSPLKTGMELYRRWGFGTKVQVGCDLTTSVDGFLTIHIQSDLVSPDQLPLDITIAPNSFFRVRGALLAANILRTSTLTNVVTAMNRAAPLGGTRLTVRDNTLANWAAFMVANRRVRMTTGAATGGTFQPQFDHVATPGEVECSPCQTTNEPGFSQTPTTVTPGVGDTYVIEKLVACNFGEINIDQSVNPIFGGISIFLNIVDLHLPSTGVQDWSPIINHGTWVACNLNFYQCTFDRLCDWAQAGSFFCIASYFTEGMYCYPGGDCGIFGGGALKIGTSQNPFVVWGAYSLFGGLDFDFCCNAMPIHFVGQGGGKNFASWNCPAGVLGNAGGHGISVGDHYAGGVSRCASGFIGIAWGAGNAGAGMLIGAGCRGAGGTQNCTGVGGDLILGQSGVGWWWNAATAVYNPVGAGIALTWAHVNAAKGAAGFGGSAHEPDLDAHWTLLEP